MTKTKKPKVVKKEIKKFSLSLDLAGNKFNAKANTFQEALKTLHKDSFGKVKTWGIFTLKIGKKKSEIQLRPIQIKRAFLGRFAQTLLEKRLTMMLR